MAANKDNIINPKVYSNRRDNFIAGLIGVNKTGKSTVAKEKIIIPWRQSRSSKFQIYGHDPQNVCDGIIPKQNLIDSENKNWALDCCKLRNCLLILYEIKILFPKPQHPPAGLLKLFSQAYAWNIDIVWEAHHAKLVPEVCTYHTNKYYLFLTFGTKKQFDNELPAAELCKAGSNYVNRYVAKYGKGRHRLDPLYDGMNFPYAIVDVQNQKLTGVNMNLPL